MQPPSGRLLIGPSVDEIHAVLFESRADFWKRGSLSVELLHIKRRGKSTEIRGDIPSLSFAYKPKHGVFLMHCDSTANPRIAIPYAKTGFSPWVKHNDGQLEWYVPRACFVSKAFAWAAILEYLHTDGRIDLLPWVDKIEIEFRLPEIGDEIPRGEDRG